MLQKLVRPKDLESITTVVETGCGHLYITVGGNNGHPIEVFASLGKAGGCSNCQNEALTRSISLGLKYGVPLVEYVEELEFIRCPNPKHGEKDSKVLSCSDGIAKVLRSHIKDERNKEG